MRLVVDLQDTKGSIPVDSLLLSLLEQYLKRVTVNRTTLAALFTAADSTAEGLIDRPQMKAALTCADPEITDTAMTTIWLERQKVTASAKTLTCPVVKLSLRCAL